MNELLQILVMGSAIVLGKCTYTTSYAEYNSAKNTITMCIGKPYKKRDLAHELGHVLWFRFLTIEDRIQYALLYNECSDSKCFARKYGQTNIKEDFATVFELYYLIEKYGVRSVNNETLRNKLIFIENVIGNITKK